MVGAVASTGIEPVSGASETLILSIVLRGQYERSKNQVPRFKLWKEDNPLGALGLEPCILIYYLIKPCAFVAKILTAMASNITPKNFLTAIRPAGPRSLAMTFNDFNTI